MKAKPKFKLALLRSLNGRSHHRDGFTLIEVIVAIVILSVFIVASLSALVAGLNLKLKAKLNNEATLLIQQDLEQVRYQATQTGLEVKVSSTPTLNPSSGNTGTVTTSTVTTATSSTSTIDLALSIPISIPTPTPTYLSTANTPLKIGDENGAYRLTSNQTTLTSPLAVTVDLGSVSSLNSISLPLASSGTSFVVTSKTPNLFQANDRIVVGPVSGTVFTTLVTTAPTSVDSTTKVITYTVNLGASMPSYASGTQVTILPRNTNLITNTKLCTDTTTNIATNFIASLSTTNGTGNDPVNGLVFNTPPFNGSTYKLWRKATATSTTRVRIEYKVAELNAPNASLATVFNTAVPNTYLAELTTEVIPNVTFQCP